MKQKRKMDTKKLRVPELLQRLVKVKSVLPSEKTSSLPILVLDTREEDAGLYRALFERKYELREYTDEVGWYWHVIFTTDPGKVLHKAKNLGLETKRLFKNLFVVNTKRERFNANRLLTPEFLRQVWNNKYDNDYTRNLSMNGWEGDMSEKQWKELELRDQFAESLPENPLPIPSLLGETQLLRESDLFKKNLPFAFIPGRVYSNVGEDMYREVLDPEEDSVGSLVLLISGNSGSDGEIGRWLKENRREGQLYYLMPIDHWRDWLTRDMVWFLDKFFGWLIEGVGLAEMGVSTQDNVRLLKQAVFFMKETGELSNGTLFMSEILEDM